MFSTLLGVLQQQPVDVVSAVLAVVGAYGTSALLAQTKKLDYKLVQVPIFKKLQPVITLAGAFAAPILASKLGVRFDPSVYSVAPISAIGAITTAELLAIARRSIPGVPR